MVGSWMKRVIDWKRWLVTAATAVPIAGVSAQNLLTNGSFELPVLPTGTNTVYPAGSPALTGWTITGQGIDHDSAFQASDGNQTISTQWTMASSVSQKIQTADIEYCLSFSATRERPELAAGQMSTRVLEVRWNAALVATISFPPNLNQTNANMMWQSFNFKVIGTGGLDTLSFTDASGLPTGYGVELDDVRLTDCNHCPSGPPSPTQAVDQRCGDLAKNVAHYSIDTLGDPNNPSGYVSVGQQALPSGFTGLHVVCWDRDGKIVVERLFQTGVASESIVGTSVDVDANCNIVVAGRAVVAGVWSTFVLKLDSKLLPICGTRIPAPTSPAGTTVEANVDVQADWLQDGSIAVYDRLKIGTETQSRITRLANNCSLIWMQRYGSLQASPGQFIIHDIEQEPVAPFDLWACGAMAWSNGGPSEILPMVMKIPVATGVCNATNLRAYDFPPLTPWLTGRFTAIKFNPTTGPNLNEAIVAGWSVKPGSGPFGTPVGVARIAAINPALAQRFDTLYSNANFLTATSAISMAKGKPAPNAIVIAGTSAFAGFGEATGWTLSADQATGAHIVTVRHALPKPGSWQWSFGDITPGANRATIGAYSDLSPFPGGGSKLWFNQHACQTLFTSGVENVAPFPLFTGELFCNAWDIVTPLPMVEVPVLSPCSIDCKYCYPDCDFSGNLSIDDFICFITLFALSDPYADCDGDGTLGIDDFICFQTFFAIGC